MNILIAGDYCDNDRVHMAINNGEEGGLFGGIQDIISKYDYRIVNFEFPVVSTVGRPIFKCGPSLIGSQKAIDMIKAAGFNV